MVLVPVAVSLCRKVSACHCFTQGRCRVTARCSRLLTRPSCLSSRLGYGLRVRLCRSKPPHVRCFWFEGATEFVKASLERKPSAKLRRSFPLPGEPRQSPLSTRPSMASSSSGVLGLALQHEGRGFRWQSMAWSPEARACMFPNLSRNGRLPCFDIEVSPKSETEEGSREGAPPISPKLGTACRPHGCSIARYLSQCGIVPCTAEDWALTLQLPILT